MKHIKEGTFRAYLDGELYAEERDHVEKHLAHCLVCGEKAALTKARGDYVQMHLQQLSVSPLPVNTAEARGRLDHRLNPAQAKSGNVLYSPRYRPVWVALVLVMVVSLMMTFAPIRALADDFLALFRIQKFAFIEFNPLNLPNSEDSLRTAAMEIERLLNEELEIVVDGDPHIVGQADVQDLVTYPVRFPDLTGQNSRITVQPGFEMMMQLNLAEIRTLLEAVGYSGVDLPQTLEGATIQAAFEPTVVTAIGSCTAEGQDTPVSDDCTVYIQTPSPQVSAPPELDLQQLGKLYLQMLGMGSAQATRFSSTIDWTTTLVVPIPSTEAAYKNVGVDGTSGTIIEGQRYHEVVLIWVKHDVIHALVGKGEVNKLLDISATID